jgi:recombinational DNA repair protein (RecF pathway)
VHNARAAINTRHQLEIIFQRAKRAVDGAFTEKGTSPALTRSRSLSLTGVTVFVHGFRAQFYACALCSPRIVPGQTKGRKSVSVCTSKCACYKYIFQLYVHSKRTPVHIMSSADDKALFSSTKPSANRTTDIIFHRLLRQMKQQLQFVFHRLIEKSLIDREVGNLQCVRTYTYKNHALARQQKMV